MRGLCDTMRNFRDSSRRFGESIRKPISNSSHPSEIGALNKYQLDTQKVKALQKLTPKQTNTENQIRCSALERAASTCLTDSASEVVHQIELVVRSSR